MFGSASRIVIRNVSADFCAVAGEAAAPSSAAATNAAPNLNCTPMSSSCSPDNKAGPKTVLKHTSCQMAFYHSLRLANHRRWRHTAAAIDRDPAARVEPAAGGNIGRIRHGVAEADIGHAEAGLRRQHALQQRLRV